MPEDHRRFTGTPHAPTAEVTEENLTTLFINCGQVVDCRMCGDPNSVLRFAFIEFADEEGARAALNLSGTVLGYYPVNVLPSKLPLHQSKKHSYPCLTMNVKCVQGLSTAQTLTRRSLKHI
uniref:RRM domain-containing protein n=1 Tax=Zea mays TaxID=4577 RepID=A0A804PGE3_MAIZE